MTARPILAQYQIDNVINDLLMGKALDRDTVEDFARSIRRDEECLQCEALQEGGREQRLILKDLVENCDRLRNTIEKFEIQCEIKKLKKRLKSL